MLLYYWTVSRYRLLVFDGDDTLWYSEELYDRARDEAAQLVEWAGLDPTEWVALQKDIDVQNFETFGLSPERFPTSSRMAYERLAARAGHDVDSAVGEAVFAASKAVFEMPARLVDGVASVLQFVAARAMTVLLTKGALEVQEKRVAESGLAGYFDEVRIVDAKTKTTFSDIAKSFNIKPSDCLSIGNSLPSDISPALAAGMHAAWIDAHVWAHERRPVDDAVAGYHLLETLDLLPAFLENGE